MKTFFSALRLLVVLIALTGAAYPLLVTMFASAMPEPANGSLIRSADGRIVGSALIQQNFTQPKYFHGRPSAVDFAKPEGLLGAGGSHLSPNAAALKEAADKRAVELRKTEGLAADAPVPADLVLGSASSMDPDISPEAAFFQVPRVAKARGLDVERVKEIILHATTPGGILGPARVNVLKLNLELDARK
jgi:K+-transporting ATPase ATPase C chain